MGNGELVSVTVLNDATQDSNIFIGTDTTLDVTLVNNSDPIILFSSGFASCLEIYMPVFFTDANVQNMSISLSDWTFSFNPYGPSLMLTYAGKDSASWDMGQEIRFQITKVKSSAQPGVDYVQVNFENMGGNAPIYEVAYLTLSNPPKPGNASLRDVLQVTLDNQGSVYVSKANDPLQNTLFLNLKNVGATPLYSGSSMWSPAPKVTVAFVYGSTSGALAPDNDKDQPVVGSAWKIKGGVPIDQTDGWKITDPSPSGDDPHPKWLLAPTNLNQEIIGIGEHSNVTFSFSEIVSLTLPGHTQMVVQFSGFRKDENTPYNDEVFVLDIVKQDPPPTRGLLNFFGDAPVVEITSPTQPINIQLRWAMFDVAQTNLICSFPGMNVVKKTYPNPLPLAYDNYTVKIPGVTESMAIFITLQSFDASGNYSFDVTGSYLNSMQFTVFINALMFVDPRDGHVYPVVLLNNQLWMAENLAHDDGTESCFYNNNSANQAYGRLYTGRSASAKTPPAPWRIPSKQDWQGLFDKYGTATAAYAALIDGGKSGFKAKLGGYRDSSNAFHNLPTYGYYRTSSADGLYAGFSSTSGSINLVATFQDTYAISIRYVRDL